MWKIKWSLSREYFISYTWIDVFNLTKLADTAIIVYMVSKKGETPKGDIKGFPFVKRGVLSNNVNINAEPYQAESAVVSVTSFLYAVASSFPENRPDIEDFADEHRETSPLCNHVVQSTKPSPKPVNRCWHELHNLMFANSGNLGELQGFFDILIMSATHIRAGDTGFVDH